MAELPDPEREAFQFYAWKVLLDTTRHTAPNTNGQYADDRTQAAWMAWQARAALELEPENTGENVVRMGGITQADLPPERVLRAAIRQKIDPVLVIGVEQQKTATNPLGYPQFYFASSATDLGENMLLLERAMRALSNMNNARMP